MRSFRDGIPSALLKMAKNLEFGDAKDKNFVLSPCSIQLALSLLASGATGETLKELLNFLGTENLDSLKSVAAKQVDILTQNSTKGGSDLSFIAGAWIDQSCYFKPKFKADAEKIYKVMKFQSVDFQNETKLKEVIDEVNEWCEEATKGHIKSVIPEDSLSENTRFVLANALYFKGVWSRKFNKHLTKEDNFHLCDGKTVQVPYMRSYDDQFISSNDDFQVLRLPYENSRISMYIILPKRSKTDGLWSLAEKVGSEPSFIEQYIRSDISYLRVRRFLLPKFKITYEFKAKKVLRDTGLQFLFSDEAELYAMLDVPRRINEVHHKSSIEVNEEGTEAAAVTEADGED